ncbi:hypothetical protein Tco_1566599 [Tanacetum coccineum]
MTGNKVYLVEYQDYNGGPVAFGGSKGYITIATLVQGRQVRSLVSAAQKCLTMVLMLGLGQRCSLDWN